jgi:hypothetical protein
MKTGAFVLFVPQNKKGVIARKIWEFFQIGSINLTVNLSFPAQLEDKEAAPQ